MSDRRPIVIHFDAVLRGLSTAFWAVVFLACLAYLVRNGLGPGPAEGPAPPAVAPSRPGPCPCPRPVAPHRPGQAPDAGARISSGQSTPGS